MDNYSSLVDILIKSECDGNPNHERILILGNTPEYLITHANFSELQLAIKASVISKACFDHGISTSLLKKLPEIVLNPKSVFRSTNDSRSDSVVVLTFEIQNSSPIIIPIRKQQQVGRSKFFNLVTSIYGKEGPDPEKKWTRAGLLLWTHPLKSG